MKKQSYPVGKPRRASATPVVLPPDALSPTMDVRRYVKADGWVTRHWAIYLGGELLAVCVYKKGAVAIASEFRKLRESAAGQRAETN